MSPGAVEHGIVAVSLSQSPLVVVESNVTNVVAARGLCARLMKAARRPLRSKTVQVRKASPACGSNADEGSKMSDSARVDAARLGGQLERPGCSSLRAAGEGRVLSIGIGARWWTCSAAWSAGQSIAGKASSWFFPLAPRVEPPGRGLNDAGAAWPLRRVRPGSRGRKHLRARKTSSEVRSHVPARAHYGTTAHTA